mgnify:CR=1 FL=1
MQPNRKDNLFESYELTPEEIVTATDFTVLQKAYIQNLLSEAAHGRLNLTYDHEHPEKFLQAEAEKQGEIGGLRFLLTINEPLTQKE